MLLDRLHSDDLLVLLAVGRTGRFTAAAETLGLNHTTIARRIDTLEQALGGRALTRGAAGWELTDLGRQAFVAGEQVEAALRRLTSDVGGSPTLSGVVRMSATDGFSAYLAAPAVVSVRRRHPGINVEIVTATRLASQNRTGLDVEIVVGEPHVHRAEAVRLADYRLGLYASRRYLEENATPASAEDLTAHPLVYFVDAMLQVDDLDLARTLVPQMAESVTSTNVFVHVEATRSHAGIGLLPCFMADRHDDLVRVLPTVGAQLSYWLVTRTESLRRPEVAAFVAAIRAEVDHRRPELLGTTRT
ncbi:LysR family transcriptional regulator [Gordonia rhizosphera]|uniref:Putative LysR family transcriptional regulator n=1 Tax=Gordonia rhizosphera NBRC 16068 TaxID=1108045 RepID=K6WQC1_9ACTN|nr:LysR family transcriptional regulator [Gordonia rhizosphera]GAB88739.1 putative LysR family transcriptional regulator [Gordonia rhizosphera NBRC 16068]